MKAVEIAKKVASGELTARSVVEQHLENIKNLETEVNAFNIVTTEKALEDADQIDARIASGETLGPLAGVPIAV